MAVPGDTRVRARKPAVGQRKRQDDPSPQQCRHPSWGPASKASWFVDAAGVHWAVWPCHTVGCHTVSYESQSPHLAAHSFRITFGTVAVDPSVFEFEETA